MLPLAATTAAATTAPEADADANEELAATIPPPDDSQWTDVDGNPIKAHGGSVVQVNEAEVDLDITGDGSKDQDVYLWYGEDKTNATRPVDGIRGYWSTDLAQWHDMGRVLPSHQFFTLRVNEDGTAVEVDPERVEEIKDAAELSSPTDDVTAEEISAAKEFVTPYVTTWADEEKSIPADYDDEKLANASYRLNGNINIMERPKMLYNELTGKFVIIYHADGPLPNNPDLIDWVRDGGKRENQDVGSRYSRAEVGFATSDTPWGPFTLVNNTKLNWAEGVPNEGREGDSRDMTVFQDSGVRTVHDGVDDAYVIYSSEMNKWMYISRLNAEYTGPSAGGSDAVLGEDFSNRVLPDYSREASSVLKYDGYYYMLTSGTDGWASTPVVAYRSPSMITDTEAVIGDNDAHPESGQWERFEIPNPCVGLADRDGVGTADPSRCFDSQPTFVIGLDQEAGHFIYMGDRWITESNGSAGERSRYVWAPIQLSPEARSLTVENVGAWDPQNSSLYRPLVPAEPLIFHADPGDDPSDFNPTIDVSVADRSFAVIAVDWAREDLAEKMSESGTYRLQGHVAGGDLDGRYVEAALVVGDVMNACLLPGSKVSATFHQTDYDVMPASNACDGDESTAWSTWASNSGYPDEVTWTTSFPRSLVVEEVSFQNIEGNPTSVRVEYQDPESGEWSETNSGSSDIAPTGDITNIEFDPVTASGIRLIFETPGTFLKVTEVTIPATEAVEEVSLVGIEVASLPEKTTYTEGEELDLTGLEITAAYSDGSRETLDAGDVTVTGYDPNTVGEQTLTVTYEAGLDAHTATFTIVVEAEDTHDGDDNNGGGDNGGGDNGGGGEDSEDPDDDNGGGNGGGNGDDGDDDTNGDNGAGNGDPSDGDDSAVDTDGNEGPSTSDDLDDIPNTGANIGTLALLATLIAAAGAALLIRNRATR